MDKIKDLKDLKSLFPELENYVPEETEETAPNELLISDKEKAGMKLYVSRDKKNRGGKQVTLVEGHTGEDALIQSLLTQLKSLCSAGGSLKDGIIMIQGDHVKKVIAFLLKNGYKQTKQKGG